MKLASALVVLLASLPLAAQTPSAADRLGFHYTLKDAPDAKPAPAVAAAGDAVVLPKFEVESSRLRFEEDELLTYAGVVRLAKKRYINPVYGVTLGPVVALANFLANPLGGWNPNTPEALLLYGDDRRTRRIREMDDLISLVNLGDAKEAKKLDSLRTGTFEGPMRAHAFPPGKR